MKAVKLQKYGSSDFLVIRDVEKPSPRANEVLVKVKAASVNDWDWGLILGAPAIPNRLLAGLLRPRITVGTDMSGVVKAVGSSVSAFKSGDEVHGDLSGVSFGGFAEYVCVPEHAVKHKAPAMTFAQAAAIPHAGMLALQAIKAGGELNAGQKILINGAGGGVGSIAIQLLKQQDVEVTGVDSAEKLDVMRSWGFHHLIDYQTVDFTRNNQRYDLIIDVKTDRSPTDYERALNPHGVYATVGGQTFPLLKIALSGLRMNRQRNKQLKVIRLQANRDLAYLNELFEMGKFKPVIDSEFEFTTSGVREAFRRFEAAAHKGKIILRLS